MLFFNLSYLFLEMYCPCDVIWPNYFFLLRTYHQIILCLSTVALGTLFWCRLNDAKKVPKNLGNFKSCILDIHGCHKLEILCNLLLKVVVCNLWLKVGANLEGFPETTERNSGLPMVQINNILANIIFLFLDALAYILLFTTTQYPKGVWAGDIIAIHKKHKYIALRTGRW